jgi:hypothetical protein
MGVSTSGTPALAETGTESLLSGISRINTISQRERPRAIPARIKVRRLMA